MPLTDKAIRNEKPPCHPLPRSLDPRKTPGQGDAPRAKVVAQREYARADVVSYYDIS